MKQVRVVTGLGLAVLAVGGLAWAVQEPMTQATWSFQSTRALSTAEREALEACEDPGWTGLTRVLEQDLAVPCPGLWVATTLAEHLDEDTTSWITATFAHDLQRPPRTRLRAATAHLLAGHPPEADLALLATDPTLPEGTTEAYVAALAEGRLEGGWADPVLRERVALRAFEVGDLTDASRVERLLRLAAVHPVTSPAEERAARVERVLHHAGLDDGRLERLVDRRRRGLSWQGVPPDMARMLDRHRGACAEHAASSCVALAADLLALLAPRERATPDAPPEALLPLPLWRVLYDGHPEAMRAAARRLGALGAWVAEAPAGARGTRLLGALAWPRSTFGPDEVRAGRVGDPALVLVPRRGTPWTTALAALAVGEVAGVEVTVRAQPDGVALEAEGREVAVGPCGVLRAVAPEPGPSWPLRAVLAQAVLEAAGGALRADDALRAARLGSLAERLDPVGARGVGEALAAGLELPQLGLQVGRAVAATDDGASEGAELARERRAREVLAGLEASDDAGACPAVLGR